MRLIDADALKEAFEEDGHLSAYIEELIDEQPTISPDEVRGVGKWIDMADFEQCSVCKGTQLKEFQSKYGKTIWIRTPYCPNCGAKMEVSEDA